MMGNKSLFKWSRSQDQDGRNPYIWQKPFENLPHNQKADDLETLYVALEMWDLLSLFYVDFDLLKAKVKFASQCS